MHNLRHDLFVILVLIAPTVDKEVGVSRKAGQTNRFPPVAQLHWFFQFDQGLRTGRCVPRVNKVGLSLQPLLSSPCLNLSELV